MSAAQMTEGPQPDRPEPLYVKVHPGPSGLDHDAVASNQRSRLIGAMIEEAAAHGYASATLARLVALAGVSKRAFHELFQTNVSVWAIPAPPFLLDDLSGQSP